MDDTASHSDLFERLKAIVAQREEAAEAFDVFKQDVLTTHDDEAAATGEPTSGEAADLAAAEVDGFTTQMNRLIAAAADDELMAAYSKIHGEPSDAIVHALQAEIGRRGMDG